MLMLSFLLFSGERKGKKTIKGRDRGRRKGETEEAERDRRSDKGQTEEAEREKYIVERGRKGKLSNITQQ